jgi:hypothetical protein
MLGTKQSVTLPRKLPTIFFAKISFLIEIMQVMIIINFSFKYFGIFETFEEGSNPSKSSRGF